MIALLLLAACTPPGTLDTAGPDVGTCGPEGGRSFWVVSAMDFARIEDGVSDGFDLDGEVTDVGDRSGCGVGDAISPTGEEGIDNAFGRMLPALDGTEFAAAAGLIAATIASGELMLIAEVSGADAWPDDDCVSASVYRGAGAPMLTTGGTILPDQTLDLDPDFPAQQFEQAELVDGSVVGRPLTAQLPLQILDASLVFELLDGAVRLDIHEDGSATGVLAGGINIAYLMTLLEEQAAGVDDGLVQLIESLLPLMADLAPDASGSCTQVSSAFTFEAVPVFVYEDALP